MKYTESMIEKDYSQQALLEILKKILLSCNGIDARTVKLRRDFHRYPEAGWTEFRTASKVVHTLLDLGFEVIFGKDALDPSSRMGVPEDSILERAQARAISEGAYQEYVKEMAGGFTAVVGIMRFGKPGPTIALRFDMDANYQSEPNDSNHKPFSEHFSSLHEGEMHSCAHDGHTAIGLFVAECLAVLKEISERDNKPKLCGSIKLIFQPAEEGDRGAYPIVKAGFVDDVDIFLSGHIGIKADKTGVIAAGTKNFLASTKFDAIFHGKASHAGAKPEQGRNALLAAANAILNLHAISRHSDGPTRINVGSIDGGTARNIICDKVKMQFETRGVTTELDNYIKTNALRIIEASANMYEVNHTVVQQGGAPSASSDIELARKVVSICKIFPEVEKVIETIDLGLGEDAAYYMERVQKNGGLATFMLFGADLASGHHERYFDFDEKVLRIAPRLLVAAILNFILL